ncbi:Hypp3855 [Branchiostoma lanceolatum]|uniref:Hypp3855 protein n=1 Tax=Branchiostoma lanceolatum TaxID=7740 RepID=A0A8K0EZJ0_BRALA|nr:Hypp3855 [Branchiostoma lanceolatum]
MEPGDLMDAFDADDIVAAIEEERLRREMKNRRFSETLSEAAQEAMRLEMQESAALRHKSSLSEIIYEPTQAEIPPGSPNGVASDEEAFVAEIKNISGEEQDDVFFGDDQIDVKAH